MRENQYKRMKGNLWKDSVELPLLITLTHAISRLLLETVYCPNTRHEPICDIH
jgi:hypothetical protein